MQILLLSDTHGWLDEAIRNAISQADQVWHAGDVGEGLLEELEQHPNFRGVYGNIDGNLVRKVLPEHQVFEAGGVKVLMKHIVGSPGNYNPETRALIKQHRPMLLIAGHSHILHVRHYPAYPVLHLNPGASGHHGFHSIRTALRFKIESGKPVDASILEWGKRGRA